MATDNKTGRKFALLIGVSEFGDGFKPLNTPKHAIAQFKDILTNPALGGFSPDHVVDLLNPTVSDMQGKIGEFFCNCRKNDVLLFYFVGHGVKDEVGKFHFTTRETRKFDSGLLNSGTAVAASFVSDQMGRSPSKRQVVILDCCFSGAFLEGTLAMDDGQVDIKQQLGGEGRVILTAATSTQYALEQEGEALSVYTRYLLEGLKTGAAAPEDHEWIEAGHLHDYVRQKLETAAASMSPQLYAAREGQRIIIARAPVGDPELRYRKLVQRHLRENGVISRVGRRRLTRQGNQLGLSPERIDAIETEVCRPFQERAENLAEYEDAYREALQHENPLSEFTQRELADYQRDLNLRDEDVLPIQTKLHQEFQVPTPPLPTPPLPTPTPSHPPTTSPTSDPDTYTEDLGNGITIEMVKIPGGSFMMGSAEGEGDDDERPQHQVTVPTFYMGKFLVTQSIYEAVTGNNPSYFKGGNRPVEGVTWHDAIAFCEKFSERTGNPYRLPSEAEWEYACRANTTTDYFFGDAIAPEQANYRESKIGETSDVGKYPPNAFGLFDMHGNVWEWCLDHWHPNYQGAPDNGSAWIEGGESALRLLRGGSCNYDPRDCRSANRDRNIADNRYDDIGFRLVCSSPRTI